MFFFPRSPNSVFGCFWVNFCISAFDLMGYREFFTRIWFDQQQEPGQKEKHIRESKKQNKFGKMDSHPEGFLFWLLWMVLVQLLIGWLVGEGVDILACCHAPLNTVILLGIQFSWLSPWWSEYHPRTAYSRSMDLRKNWVNFPVCHGNWTVIAYTFS